MIGPTPSSENSASSSDGTWGIAKATSSSWISRWLLLYLRMTTSAKRKEALNETPKIEYPMAWPDISPGRGFPPPGIITFGGPDGREDGDEDADGREDGDGDIIGLEDGDEDIDGLDDGANVSNVSIALAAASHTFNT